MKKWSCEELNLDNLPNNFLPVQFSDKARLPCSTIHFVSTFFADMNITSLTLVEMEGKTKIVLRATFRTPTTQITSRQGSSSLVSLDVPSVL